MSYFYLPALGKAIDWVNDDLRVLLVKSGHTSANTDEFLGDFADLDECDGTGYDPGPGGSGRKQLTSKSININSGDERAEFLAANLLWSGVDTDAGPATAAICYRHNSGSDDNLNEALFLIDDGGFPFDLDPPNFTLLIPAAGLWQRQMG